MKVSQNMRILTKQQIARQDFVDNKVFELINSLLPSPEQIEWNIEIIGDVRELIYKKLREKSKGITKEQFYPFIKM